MQTATELVAMGKAARDAGRTDDALALYVAAANLLQEGDEVVAWAHALRHVADLQLELKLVKEARESIEAVLKFYRERGPGVLEMANALRIAALVEEAAGQVDAAREAWVEAVELYEEVGVGAGAREGQRRLAALD